MELPSRAFKLDCGCVVVLIYDAEDCAEHRLCNPCKDCDTGEPGAGPYWTNMLELVRFPPSEGE